MLYNPQAVALGVDRLYKRYYLQTRALQNSVGLDDDQSIIMGSSDSTASTQRHRIMDNKQRQRELSRLFAGAKSKG